MVIMYYDIHLSQILLIVLYIDGTIEYTTITTIEYHYNWW